MRNLWNWMNLFHSLFHVNTHVIMMIHWFLTEFINLKQKHIRNFDSSLFNERFSLNPTKAFTILSSLSLPLNQHPHLIYHHHCHHYHYHHLIFLLFRFNSFVISLIFQYYWYYQSQLLLIRDTLYPINIIKVILNQRELMKTDNSPTRQTDNIIKSHFVHYQMNNLFTPWILNNNMMKSE